MPDFIDEANGVIGESKNVAKLSYTRQLRDYVDKAKEMGTQLELYVRQDTVLSGPLKAAIKDNYINLRKFNW